MSTRAVIAVLAISALSACVPTSQATRAHPKDPPLPPTCPVGIAVYSARAEAPADYREVALLTTTKSGALALDLLRRRAAEVGATGFVFGSTVTTSDGVKILGPTIMKSESQTTDALAVYSASDLPRLRKLCGPG